MITTTQTEANPTSAASFFNFEVPRSVYRLADSSIKEILEIIQEALINETPVGLKLSGLRYVPSQEDERDLVTSDAGIKLSGTVLAQLGNLVQLAFASHTPFIDHVRIVLLEQNQNGEFTLTPEYVEHYNATVEAMIERAKVAFKDPATIAPSTES